MMRGKKIFTLCLFFIFTGMVMAGAQPERGFKFKSWQTGVQTIPDFYIHGSAGIGVAFLSSSDFNDLVGNVYGIEMAFPLSYGLKAGYSTLLQVEYRSGDSSHDLVSKAGGESVIFQTDQVKMDYDYTEFLLKFNPLYKIRSRQNTLFIIAGSGKAKWRIDGSPDGYKGQSMIIGLEATRIRSYVSVAMSVKYYSINFDEGYFYNPDSTESFKAGNFSFELTVSAGLGN